MTDEAETRDHGQHDLGKDEPQFIIAHDGKYYLTRTVLEYDPRHTPLTEAQRIGIGEMGDLFARLAREGWGRTAVVIPVPHIQHGYSHQHT